ncbi:MAG: hypothetical protein R3348_06165 [Xanthomonadales bacterium]|nr:hypothetical protein [Xanthomonadales bacterium]
MNRVSDEDLVLLYYGEHDDPGLARRVAEDAELAQRYQRLTQELALADEWRVPERGADFGADVWQRISPRLASRAEPDPGAAAGRFSSWLQPRFSLAGVLGLLLVAVLAFQLGQQGGIAPAGLQQPGVAKLEGFSRDQLLSSALVRHFEQLNVNLTGFAHADSDVNGEDWATDLLVANRLYRRAAAASGDQRLAAFLAEIEPLLIEIAYQAQSHSETTRLRLKNELADGLLFRIRVMKQQLNATTVKA